MTYLLALLVLSAAPATSADPIAPLPVADAASQAPVAASLAESPLENSGAAPAPLPLEELDELRGGQTIVVGNQTLTAITSGNVLNGDYVAGSVSFSDNAFANFNGIGNLAINTGAQVSLQSGMSVVINVDR